MPTPPPLDPPALPDSVGLALERVIAAAQALSRSIDLANAQLAERMPVTGMTLQEWLPLSGFTATEWAQRLGMHVSTMIELSRGRRWPNSATARRILEGSQGVVTRWDIVFFEEHRRIHAYQRAREEVDATKAARAAKAAAKKAEHAAKPVRRRRSRHTLAPDPLPAPAPTAPPPPATKQAARRRRPR